MKRIPILPENKDKINNVIAKKFSGYLIEKNKHTIDYDFLSSIVESAANKILVCRELPMDFLQYCFASFSIPAIDVHKNNVKLLVDIEFGRYHSSFRGYLKDAYVMDQCYHEEGLVFFFEDEAQRYMIGRLLEDIGDVPHVFMRNLRYMADHMYPQKIIEIFLKELVLTSDEHGNNITNPTVESALDGLLMAMRMDQ